MSHRTAYETISTLTAERDSLRAQLAEVTAQRDAAKRGEEFTRWWWSTRYDRVDRLMREEAPEPLRSRFFCTVANGNPASGEEYGRSIEKRMEALEQERDAAIAEVERLRADRVAACPCKTAPNREAAMVTIERKPDGTPSVWCDPCIAPIIRALNAGGVATIASCCGHQNRPGSIVLADGREMIMARTYEEARAVESHFPNVNGEAPRADRVVTREQRENMAINLAHYYSREGAWSVLPEARREAFRNDADNLLDDLGIKVEE